MKKIGCLFLTIAVMITLTQYFPVSAAKKYDPSKMTLTKYMIANMADFNKKIDLTYYLKKYDFDFYTLIDEVGYAIDNSPEIIHFDIKITKNYKFDYTYDINEKYGNIIFTAAVLYVDDYLMTKTEYEKNIAALKNAANDALKYAKDCVTDEEKALAMHDYLIANTKYDCEAAGKFTSYSDSTGGYMEDYAEEYWLANTAYAALVKRTAINCGYAKAYMYLLKKLGIDSVYVKETKSFNSWNYVKIDGKWYHVDTAWDDPILTYYLKNEIYGAAWHTYFLISDAKMKELRGCEWVISGDYPKATSKTYNNRFWRNLTTPVIKLGDYWYWTELDEKNSRGNTGTINTREMMTDDEFFGKYYSVITKVVRSNTSTKKKSTIHKFESIWYDNMFDGFHSTTFSRLAMYNNKLYFNSADKIYSIDADGKNLNVIVDCSDETVGDIYGLTMSGNKLEYSFQRSLHTYAELFKKKISA